MYIIKAVYIQSKVEKCNPTGIHTFSKCVICYFTNFIGLGEHLFLAQI